MVHSATLNPPFINSIDFSNRVVPTDDERVMPKICKSVQTGVCKYVTKLNFIECSLDVNASFMIAEMLQDAPYLRELMIDSNEDFTPDSLVAIALALEKNTTLLQLSCTSIGSNRNVEQTFADILGGFNYTLLKLGLKIENAGLRVQVSAALLRNQKKGIERRTLVRP